jgi:hypothetical protein
MMTSPLEGRDWLISICFGAGTLVSFVFKVVDNFQRYGDLLYVLHQLLKFCVVK